MRKAMKVMSGLILASVATATLAAETASGNTLRLYNWTDYIGAHDPARPLGQGHGQ